MSDGHRSRTVPSGRQPEISTLLCYHAIGGRVAMQQAQAIICEAIRDKRLLSFTYKYLHRVVEPHILGYDSDGDLHRESRFKSGARNQLNLLFAAPRLRAIGAVYRRLSSLVTFLLNGLETRCG